MEFVGRLKFSILTKSAANLLAKFFPKISTIRESTVSRQILIKSITSEMELLNLAITNLNIAKKPLNKFLKQFPPKDLRLISIPLAKHVTSEANSRDSRVNVRAPGGNVPCQRKLERHARHASP